MKPGEVHRFSERDMSPVDLVRLRQLMDASVGNADIAIGLIDGPVEFAHPELTLLRERLIALDDEAICAAGDGHACGHGTFVAGVLGAARHSRAPGICPGCTLLVHSVFTRRGEKPSATVKALARAIERTVAAGARVLNISLEIARRTEPASESILVDALDSAVRRGVLVVVATGNGGRVGASVMTGHPGVIPVVAFDAGGRWLSSSNLCPSIGRNGIGAPGQSVTSLAPGGQWTIASGTSVSAPFVSGTIALLLSLFPQARPGQIRQAIAGPARRTAIVPPMLDALAASRALDALRVVSDSRNRRCDR